MTGGCVGKAKRHFDKFEPDDLDLLPSIAKKLRDSRNQFPEPDNTFCACIHAWMQHYDNGRKHVLKVLGDEGIATNGWLGTIENGEMSRASRDIGVQNRILNLLIQDIEKSNTQPASDSYPAPRAA